MKKYKFKLQTVLDMREKVLNEKLLELSKIMHIFQAEKGKLENLRTNQTSLTKELNEIYNASGTLDINKISSYKNYLKKLGEEINAQQNLLVSIEKLVQEKQSEVNIAMQDKKIMEKLKEKEEKKYYGHIEYLEKQEIDDIAISRYKRQG